MWSTAGTWTARRRRKFPPRSSRLQFDRHVVPHSPAQLGENVERLAEQPVALADRVVGGAVGRLLQDRGLRLDRLAFRVTASVADRDGHSRGGPRPSGAVSLAVGGACGAAGGAARTRVSRKVGRCVVKFASIELYKN